MLQTILNEMKITWDKYSIRENTNTAYNEKYRSGKLGDISKNLMGER